MGFNAGTVTEPMEWDFTAYGTPDDKGVVPEPSIEMADAFTRAYVTLLQTLVSAQQRRSIERAVEDANRASEDIARLTELQNQDVDTVATLSASQLLDDLDTWAAEVRVPTEEIRRINEEMIKICADVCQGSPSEAQIRLLPSRTFRAFVGWLNEEISAPKFNFGENATSDSPVPATSA